MRPKIRPLNNFHLVKYLTYHMLSTVRRWEGYTNMRHNEIRDTFAKIMRDVFYEVEVETTLQLLQGESIINKTTRTDENARLDIMD